MSRAELDLAPYEPVALPTWRCVRGHVFAGYRMTPCPGCREEREAGEGCEDCGRLGAVPFCSSCQRELQPEVVGRRLRELARLYPVRDTDVGRELREMADRLGAVDA